MNRVRCAIYTRKSSEEGLEQDFNSLHAQREACAAYVMSQASEGWQLLPAHYDDGGVSGGTLERPGLQQLLADIASGQIDTVVCYKVDRLSRSLFDFAKLVEAFEQAGVSFVSVTQSFNTTTSMGRLTLNMLLSFAQFEREVTAERIRDKIAASKAKGMWMGGTPPLGYRPDGRSLAIVEDHAVLVRDIYARYLALGSVRRLAQQLEAERTHVPRRLYGTGRAFGGGPFSRGQLYFILKNPIYAGDIPHRDMTYPGNHPAIIDRETWDCVQQKLADNTQGDSRARLPHRSLLAGLIVDDAGEPMLASHATKGSVRYHYYASPRQQTGTSSRSQPLRLPAREIETAVKERAAQLLSDPLALAARLGVEISPALLQSLSDRCSDLAAALRQRSGGPLRDVVTQVQASDGKLEIDISTLAIARALGIAEPDEASPPLTLEVDYRLTRTGRAVRLVQEGGAYARGGEANLSLVGLVVEARRLWARLASGEVDIRTLARETGRNDSYVTRLVRIAFLSPEVADAILEGRQHGGLSARTLRDPAGIPECWAEQAARFLPKTPGRSLERPVRMG